MTDQKNESPSTQSLDSKSDVYLCEGETVLFCPTSPRFKGAFLEVAPKDIDHLRELLGVPADATQDKACGSCNPVLRTRIPSPDELTAQDVAVRGQAFNLAYLAAHEYVRGGAAALSQWKPFLNTYLVISKARIRIGWVQDIVVQNGATLTISRLAHVLRANRIQLYGTGRLVCQGPTTFRVQSIEGNIGRLADPRGSALATQLRT